MQEETLTEHLHGGVNGGGGTGDVPFGGGAGGGQMIRRFGLWWGGGGSGGLKIGFALCGGGGGELLGDEVALERHARKNKFRSTSKDKEGILMIICDLAIKF
ncbi:hypothetical protein LIER_25825 [Lithospermum erythrorhizon]|uniref:Uncharacterized protein n=1 Tax=Lithospermum erythrorhizon TaxID=34254 RepID=A0AAV3R681_LITER